MRTPDRIIALAALGLALGLTPAIAFEGTSPPAVTVVPPPAPPTAVPAPRRSVEVADADGDVVDHRDAPGPMMTSFRDGPQDQTRNLEIPGSMLRIAPE